ncbi:MAG: PHP domain-containing protein, partial [Nitrospirae bacterium]|nr:PHP domain-containing protein [Nitrospirota bacterium]
ESFLHQPVQNGYYDYQGVIHFHTNYSGDATGTFEEISAVANRQKVDFMISTDHNTLQPLDDQREGWYQNTLFLVGEEISLDEGYLLALDIQHLKRLPDEKTEEIVADILNQGGMLLIAHPNHPKWRWRSENEAGITGEEVLDFADQWYTAGTLALIKGLSFYPFNPSAAFFQLYERPDETLRGWDKRNLKQKTVGIFAPDFHQAVRITREFKIPFPGVESVLPLAHDHILLKNPFSRNLMNDRKSLYDALRKGHLYFAMDLIGNAAGFFFSARQENQTAWMGDQLPSGTQTYFSVRLPPVAAGRTTLIRVLKNGVTLFTSGEREFHFQSSGEGAYRIEVETGIPTFWGSHKNVVWIYSNPIYLR